MSTTRIMFLQRELEKELARQERIESFHLDEFGDDDVIFFKYRFSTSERLYSYAAVKHGGLWYLTGPRAPKGYNDEELAEWLSQGCLELWYATEWEQLQ